MTIHLLYACVTRFPSVVQPEDEIPESDIPHPYVAPQDPRAEDGYGLRQEQEQKDKAEVADAKLNSRTVSKGVPDMRTNYSDDALLQMGK
jgi:hypothetical protein